ncbi:hypothetical protein [Ilyomonas limi]|uniref:hypothetical protein n=1 Tax=Ilyomonas limi TaxID=2575867 RepID=UPI001485BBEC|nr:hypothetical protein [Ilyomonas limi]
MEKAVKKMREEAYHQHQELSNQERENKTEKTGTELEAQLKTQEFKEMLKRLK